MAYNLVSLNELTEQFASLPGIGKKTAARLAFHMLTASPEKAKRFANSLINAREKIHFCSVCQALTEEELCPVCSDKKRDKSVICVVEEPMDVLAFERAREYNGLYHVLHGTISPLDGIGPDQLKIRELLKRVAEPEVEEIIIATNPSVEGEATAAYLARLLKQMSVKVSRLGFGIPIGGALEHTDEITLQRAIDGRQEI
ncbi:MAG: recombination protein RecR [Clostridia bacterium]|nr:recombination protein RecR [Clostridia bacterium]